MVDALSIARRSLKDLWEEFVLLIVLNLLWTLAAALVIAPFYLLFYRAGQQLMWAIALSLLLSLPLSIVSGALCYVTNKVTHGVVVGWGTFVTGIRCYWTKSLVVGVVDAVVLYAIATNLQFYLLAVPGTWGNVGVGVWLAVGLYWLLVHIYWFPTILELQSGKVFIALRNSLAMVIVAPGFSLSVALLGVLISAVCVVLTMPAAVFLAAWLLLIANHATRSRIARLQKKPYRPKGEFE